MTSSHKQENSSYGNSFRSLKVSEVLKEKQMKPQWDPHLGCFPVLLRVNLMGPFALAYFTVRVEFSRIGFFLLMMKGGKGTST